MVETIGRGSLTYWLAPSGRRAGLPPVTGSETTEHPLAFARAADALGFLKPLAFHGEAMRGLRRLANMLGFASQSNGADADVLEYLAQQMASRRVSVVGRRTLARVGAAAEESTPEPAPRPVAPASPAVRRVEAREPDPPTFSANAQQALQARVLVLAAAAGTPFCEECERSHKGAA